MAPADKVAALQPTASAWATAAYCIHRTNSTLLAWPLGSMAEGGTVENPPFPPTPPFLNQKTRFSRLPRWRVPPDAAASPPSRPAVPPLSILNPGWVAGMADFYGV